MDSDKITTNRFKALKIVKAEQPITIKRYYEYEAVIRQPVA
jgi:hypothetical protein